MPVVKINLKRLQQLVGKKITTEKIVSKIPFLGLDIEEETKDYLRVEYSPNRPDYATDFGIALGLQGLVGTKKGMPKLSLKKSNYSVKVESSIKKIRPFITSIVAKNGSLDDESLRQLITLQEDLHFGIGRRRKKASIGIHALEKIQFPITYKAVAKNHKFIPLNSTLESSLVEILEKSEVGQQYGSILDNCVQLPIILDSKGNTISFPPIINSDLTKVSSKSSDLLIEVTAVDKKTAEDVLSVIAITLQAAGFQLFSVKITGANNSSPKFSSKKLVLNSELVNNILGLNLTSTAIAICLKKSRIDAVPRKNKIICTIPRFRFDIFGPMDLIEEVALGYGIENLKPSLPSSISVGQINNRTKVLNSFRMIMVGLGYTEALNSSLVSNQIHNELTNRDNSEIIQVVETKSIEHNILRDSIIPGLLENLSKNIHEQYPQKLFEIGTVFSKANPISEDSHLAGVCAHKDANFSEIKSVLQSSLKIGFSIVSETKPSSHPFFSNGKTANILVKNKIVGILGEVDSKVIENFKIRVPVVAFELQLSGLIFD